MEFWGVEVKAGSPLKVTPEMGKLIHISQAALGEGKKEKGSILPLRVKINDKKFVVGSLSADNFPQITFDLIFEKEFELSHDWKNGSVYFCGYVADSPYDDEEGHDFDSEDEEDLPVGITENGKVEPKPKEVKPAASKGKAEKPESSANMLTVVEPKKDESDSDDDSEDDSDDDSDDSEDDEEMVDGDSDDISGSEDEDDSEDDSDDSDDETPKKPADKKRPNESASKTRVPAKKSKVDSAQKTDGKKGGHVATPHPSKKPEKTPASSKQTPKSDAKIACNSCPKKFTSEGALSSHMKAKHAAK